MPPLKKKEGNKKSIKGDPQIKTKLSPKNSHLIFLQKTWENV